MPTSFRIYSLGFVAMVAGIVYALGCGSSGATGDSSSTVSLTGTVNAPASASADIGVGKGIGKAAVSDAAAADLTCAAVTFEGEEIGSATSDSSGNFTIAASLTDLRPSDATAGGSWTAPVQITCTNSDSTIEQKYYGEFDVVEGTTTTLSATINSDTTFAMASVLLKYGCTPKKGTACTKPPGVDLECLFFAQKAAMEQTDLSGDGVADEAGYLKESVKAAMAAGVKPSSLGYDNWGAVIAAGQNGDLSDGAASQLASTAATTLGTDASTLQSTLLSADDALKSLRETLTDVLAGSAGLASISVGKGVAVEGSACAKAIGDATYAKALVAGVLEAESAADIAKIFGSAKAFQAIIGAMGKETDGDYTEFLGMGPAWKSYLGEYNGDYSGFEVNDAAVGGLYKLCKDEIYGGGLAEADAEKYMKGWFGQVSASGGWNSFCPSGTCDANKIDLTGTYFLGSTFDPTKVGASYYQDIDDSVLDKYSTMGTAALDACAAIADLTLRQSCYASSVGASGFGGGDPTFQAPPSDGGGTPTPTPTPAPAPTTPNVAATWSFTVGTGSGGNCQGMVGCDVSSMTVSQSSAQLTATTNNANLNPTGSVAASTWTVSGSVPQATSGACTFVDSIAITGANSPVSMTVFTRTRTGASGNCDAVISGSCAGGATCSCRVDCALGTKQ
ncbi:MAG: hypothetical protein HYV03_02375 [Deltaproteobacteria bacterium]|nr:hypothetical protein [Deltaproteobacteria bacterium]